ncbi:hypothetical protein [Streptomyces sp. CA-251251]|uniref:hypothetical protein n=1 Tax=Streptomyces sp. CA-251251 TaxID=3240063 RepID=UPI003D8DC078
MSGTIMARISRRHLLRTAGASVVAAALALPVGVTVAAADPRDVPGGSAGAPERVTDPPPSPSSAPDEPDGPVTPPAPDTTTPPKPGDTTEPAEPDSDPPGEPSEDSPPPDTDTTDGQTSAPSPDRETGIAEATTDLEGMRQDVPEELTATVDTLLTLVSTVKSPETSPQDRQGVVESTEHLTTALAAINDPQTPPELRRELTSVVKQVTSTLRVVSDPRAPAEERSMLILVVKRSTSTLPLICAPGTPQELRDKMIAGVKDSAFAAEHSADGGESAHSPEGSGAPAPDATVRRALPGKSGSDEITQDERTPPEERERLVTATQQVSALLKKISDPETSSEERAEATRDLDDKTARMKDQQEQAASAQERPEESLGKAAAVCTSAIFDSTSESALARGLEKLVPPDWEGEGIKDFWKAEEKTDDRLEVLAQLRNNENARGPFDVVPLITELAEIVPHDELFGSLGGSALSCKQTATYLEEKFGITVGTWLS